MAFNYATGQYEPDQPQQVQPTMNDWYRLAGFGAGGANPNMNYASAAGGGGGGGTPPLLNGGQVDPVTGLPTQGVNLDRNQAPPNGYLNPADDPAWRAAHSGNPQVTTPLPMGTVSNGTNKPGGVDFSSPTVVPDLMQQQAPQSPLQIFSQNSGTVYGSPALAGDFWSNTAGHYVDPLGNTDATGRVLSDAEKQYWQGYDHARASGTLDTYLKTVTNPGLAAGTQATYAPGVQTTTIPGRFLDTTGANPAAAQAAATGQPGAAPAAAAGAQTQYNPLDPAWDYSKTQSVPWQAFVKNLFAEDNANQLGFKELQVPQGQAGLTPQQVDQASKLYGWQPIVGSAGTDPNVVYRAAIQAAMGDPTSDYSIVRMQNPADGTVSLGIMKREQSQQAQEARGFYAPGSTNPNSPANKAAAQARARASSYGGATGGKTVYQKPTGPTGPAGPTQQQIATGVKTLMKPIQGALNQQKLADWAATHPYSGPYATQNMPPAPMGPPLPSAQAAPKNSYVPVAGTGSTNLPGVPNANIPEPSGGSKNPNYRGDYITTPDGTMYRWDNGSQQYLPIPKETPGQAPQGSKY